MSIITGRWTDKAVKLVEHFQEYLHAVCIVAKTCDYSSVVGFVELGEIILCNTETTSASDRNAVPGGIQFRRGLTTPN